MSLFRLQKKIKFNGGMDYFYVYNLINSSPTAAGVRMPRSVNRSVMNDGGV